MNWNNKSFASVTGRIVGSPTDSLITWLVGCLTEWLINWLIDLTDYLTESLTGWLIDWLIERLINLLTHWLIGLIRKLIHFQAFLFIFSLFCFLFLLAEYLEFMKSVSTPRRTSKLDSDRTTAQKTSLQWHKSLIVLILSCYHDAIL